ncbi:RagB/SusD family nutrient uptake outer membrane protein [Dyadobacter sp. LJ53]|uniref:RagB/SusD family nutrient uptake outer membrane protein n=1 Tax=Dyadobacter chenwenxiniae TaxID=2906456 RepID=UPI001F244203|nr:RagB/SusD family nutrient uptake outer membrane protein [Dyadobacter chenwenxiniae]MCF0052426.1 RagB/SusD family nutrient uptake outer membrane protein [Dyadobacter chenwenxiniae]
MSAILFFVSGSCSKSFLDLDPYTQIPYEDAIATPANMQAALNGCYAQLASPNLFGRSLPLIGDLASDNVYLSSRNSGKYIAFDQNLITTNNNEYRGIWFDAYKAILRINNVINANLPADESVGQMKGEAYALRALMYFTLIRTFARPFTDDPLRPGVPLVLTYNPSLRPPRNSIREVYDQITADLDFAGRMIVYEKGSAHFSRPAVTAMKAKVNLYQANYEKAFVLAKQVIDEAEYTLLSRDEFLSYWASAKPHLPGDRRETLFEVSADEFSNAGSDELSYLYQQTGYGDALAGASLVELYTQADIRGKLIAPQKREAAENPAFVVNKYSHITGDYDDKKLIRLSEIYLIAAEAAFRLNQEDKALYYLNTLVNERDPSHKYSSSGQRLLDNIILERRKELAFEGDRFHDLNRLKSDIIKKDGQFPVTIPFSHPFRIAPIPQEELNQNQNIEQNDGY